MKNPFADYGNIVSGKRFIERRELLQKIESRVLDSEGGNLSIIGQRRVGKSSLAYNAIMVRSDELIGKHILSFEISVGSYNSPKQFFNDLVNKCFQRLDKLDRVKQLVRSAAEQVQKQDIQHFSFGLIRDFFDEVQISGHRVIFILDEFDKVTTFFNEDRSFLDRLRDISYKGQSTLVLISRNSISDIEEQNDITSTLAGVCIEQHVGMFEELEANIVFERLNLFLGDLKLCDVSQQKIKKYCGRHPYLLDTVAYQISEQFKIHGKIEIEAALRKSERTFYQEFNGIVNHLRIKGLIEPLKKALFGSSKHVPRMKLIELEDYGLIQSSGNNNYQAFSQHFEDYFWEQVTSPILSLTPMEMKVLYCLQQGLQNQEIAKTLTLTSNTIKTHTQSIYRKLDVNSRHEAVARAYELENSNESAPD